MTSRTQTITYLTLLSILLSVLPCLGEESIYTNLWAVEIRGGERVARDVAESSGFIFVNQASCRDLLFQNRLVAIDHFQVETNKARWPKQKMLPGQLHLYGRFI